MIFVSIYFSPFSSFHLVCFQTLLIVSSLKLIGVYRNAPYHSYVNCYKDMVERMMKDDLALKGNIDGAELLIFPSNQLPKKSQCKNILLFIVLLIAV